MSIFRRIIWILGFSLLWTIVPGCTAVHPNAVIPDKPIGSLLRKSISPKLNPRLQHLEELMYSSGDIQQAEQEAKSLLKEDPSLALAHEVLGFIAILKGDILSARDHFQMALLDGAEPNGQFYLIRMLSSYEDKEILKKNIGTLKQIVQFHPDHHLRLFAAHYLNLKLRTLGQWDEAKAVQSERHMISQWSFIGGFDNDQNRGFLTAYPPESGIYLNEKYEGQRWLQAWRQNPKVNASGLVNLRDLLSPNNWNIAYLVTYIYSPSAGKAILHLSSSDAIRAWVNDRLVLSHADLNALEADNLSVEVTLQQGWNKLLLKSAQREEQWLVGARLSDLKGNPFPKIKYTATPQTYRPQSDQAARWSIRTHVEAHLPRCQSKARKMFLSAMLSLDLVHDTKSSTRYMDLMEQQAPDSPLVWYFGALAYWSNEQNNKSTNYLRLGAEKYSKQLPAFYLKRAQWFAFKHQWREATRLLLEAIAQKPNRPDWKLILARQYSEKEWNEEELTLLQEVIKEAPTLAEGYGLLGECLQRLGRITEAEKAYRQGISYDADSQNLYRDLIKLLEEKGDWDHAIALAKQALALDPSNIISYTRLGDIYRKAKQPALAETYYRQAQEIDPQWSRPYSRLGALGFEQGQKSQAIELWRKALSFSPENHNLWERLEQLAPSTSFVLSDYAPTENMVLKELQDAQGEKYPPEASYVYLIDEEACQWMEDGTSRGIITEAKKILDDRAKSTLGEVSLRSGGYLQLNFAFVIDADGTRTDVSSMQKRKLIFPKLKVGSTIVYQYIQHQGNDGFMQNDQFTKWWFQTTTGHERRGQFTLISPARSPLHVFIDGPITRKEQKILSHGKPWRVNIFSAKDIPPLVQEGMNRDPQYYLAKVVVSTIKNWEEQVKWKRAMFDGAIRVTPEIIKLAQTLAPGSLSTKDRIKAIYDFVVQKIRYEQDYAFKIEGVKPHQAAMVLQQGYGDCKDKTVLLIALLKAIGVKAQYVTLLTTDDGPVYPQVPGQQFNHAIVYVPQQRGVEAAFFLDSTANYLELDTLREDDQGALALVIDKKSHQFLPIPYSKPEQNIITLGVELDLAKDATSSSNFHLTARGAGASLYRRSVANRGRIEQFIRYLATEMVYGDASVNHFQASEATDITNPFSIKATFNSPGLVQQKKQRLEIKPPMLFSKMSFGKWNHRQLPLYFGVPGTIETRLNINIPPGFTYKKHNPSSKQVEAYGCLTYTKETIKEKNNLSRREIIRWSCVEVPADQYPAFKKFWDRVMRHTSEHINLER